MEILEVPKDHYLVKSLAVYGKVAHIRWKSSEELASSVKKQRDLCKKSMVSQKYSLKS